MSGGRAAACAADGTCCKLGCRTCELMLTAVGVLCYQPHSLSSLLLELDVPDSRSVRRATEQDQVQTDLGARAAPACESCCR